MTCNFQCISNGIKPCCSTDQRALRHTESTRCQWEDITNAADLILCASSLNTVQTNKHICTPTPPASRQWAHAISDGLVISSCSILMRAYLNKQSSLKPTKSGSTNGGGRIKRFKDVPKADMIKKWCNIDYVILKVLAFDRPK